MEGAKAQRWCFWGLTGMALAALALVVVNIFLFLGNREIQAEINTRQGFINQSIQHSRLNAELIQALATLSAETDDEQIRNLLAVHGVTYTVNAPAPAAPETAGEEGEQSSQ